MSVFSSYQGDIRSGLPAWTWMWGTAFAIFGLLKGITWWQQRWAAPAWKQIAYLFAWPGMDATAFLEFPQSGVRHPDLGEWTVAIFNFCLGLGLIAFSGPLQTIAGLYAGGCAGFAGIVFVLHFGLFHIASCGWRSAGILAAPIMNWPIASQSVSEFWSRRWNMAFRDLTHRFLFRPLTRRMGATNAMMIGFLASGIVHDVVISGPAGGGWGLPTCYFIVQSVGVLLERTRWGNQVGLDNGFIGRIWSFAVIGLPCPLLFHRPFVCNVIVPFLNFIGATS